MPYVGVCLVIQFFHDDPPITGSMGSSWLGSSNILLHNPQERWEITKEDVVCPGIYTAMCCHHFVLYMHLLESSPEQKKPPISQVSFKNYHI
jgi:hypothetical protein